MIFYGSWSKLNLTTRHAGLPLLHPPPGCHSDAPVAFIVLGGQLLSRSSRSLWTCSLLAIRFAIITLKSNFRGSLKESQFGWGTQNSYLSWEIKTLRSIQCQDLQFLNEKIKPNLKLNENLEKHASPRFVIFHHTWRHPQLLLVPAIISKWYHLNSSIGWFNSEKATFFITSSKA